MTEGTSEMRPVDQARATQFVMSMVTGDRLMFAATFQEVVDDDYGVGELGSLINVIRSMAGDLAGAILDVHGQETAEALLREQLVRWAS